MSMSLSKRVAMDLMIEIDKAVDKWRYYYLECLKNDLKNFQGKKVDDESDKGTEKILSDWFVSFLGAAMVCMVEVVNQKANDSDEKIERLHKNNQVRH